MWKCEACGKKFNNKKMAVEVQFGYIEEGTKTDQYRAFTTENSWAPLCDDCAIGYIKGEIG